ncbi:MAG: sensor histidine kinase [Saprospiraceae bacterium]|nr:sensor histidine kinase [Saprospiraceae bacterium]
MTYIFNNNFSQRIYISLLLLLSFTGQVCSQDIKPNGIDSVFVQINKLFRNDSKRALDLLDSIKTMVYDSGTDEHKFNFHFNYYKVIYFAKGEKNKALFQLHNAKKFANGFKDLALVYNKLGKYHHRSSGMLDSSMYFQIKAIETIKKHSDTYSLTHYYSDIADLYLTLNDLTNASKFIDQSLDISRKGGKRIDYGYGLHNAIEIYKQMNDTLKLAALQAEYAQFKNEKKDNSKVAHEKTSFNKKGSERNSFLHESISVHEVNKDLTLLLTKRILLADQMQLEKKYAEAIQTLEKGIPFLNDSVLIFKQSYFTKLKNLHTLTENHKSALAYTDSIIGIENKLFDESRMNAIREMEAKYNKLEQDNLIALLQKDRSISKRNFYLALLVILFLILVSAFVYLLYDQKKKNLTLLQHKNDTISAMLTEKDILLKEIHHRVKNNLQVVSSLLNLQSNYISDEIALEAINEGKNRVLSMALIHQNLYSDEHLTAIETKGYFDDLLDQLFESYNIDEEHIKLVKDIDNFLIDVDTMIPLGLITNELISNALKHAFKGKESGQILFSVHHSDKRIRISIKDNGIGVDPTSFSASRSFGNKMIQAFVQKLKADLDVRNDNGTEILMTIPMNILKAERA